MSQQASQARTSSRLARSAAGQLVLLLAQFLIGIAVNLIGLPAELSDITKTEAAALLAIHLLAAGGLLAGAVLSLLHARGLPSQLSAMALRGFGTIVVAVAAGILDFLTGSDWWSYLMAAAATAALVFYGLLFLGARGRS